MEDMFKALLYSLITISVFICAISGILYFTSEDSDNYSDIYTRANRYSGCFERLEDTNLKYEEQKEVCSEYLK